MFLLEKLCIEEEKPRTLALAIKPAADAKVPFNPTAPKLSSLVMPDYLSKLRASEKLFAVHIAARRIRRWDGIVGLVEICDQLETYLDVSIFSSDEDEPDSDAEQANQKHTVTACYLVACQSLALLFDPSLQRIDDLGRSLPDVIKFLTTDQPPPYDCIFDGIADRPEAAAMLQSFVETSFYTLQHAPKAFEAATSMSKDGRKGGEELLTLLKNLPAWHRNMRRTILIGLVDPFIDHLRKHVDEIVGDDVEHSEEAHGHIRDLEDGVRKFKEEDDVACYKNWTDLSGIHEKLSKRKAQGNQAASVSSFFDALDVYLTTPSLANMRIAYEKAMTFSSSVKFAQPKHKMMMLCGMLHASRRMMQLSQPDPDQSSPVHAFDEIEEVRSFIEKLDSLTEYQHLSPPGAVDACKLAWAFVAAFKSQHSLSTVDFANMTKKDLAMQCTDFAKALDNSKQFKDVAESTKLKSDDPQLLEVKAYSENLQKSIEESDVELQKSLCDYYDAVVSPASEYMSALEKLCGGMADKNWKIEGEVTDEMEIGEVIGAAHRTLFHRSNKGTKAKLAEKLSKYTKAAKHVSAVLKIDQLAEKWRNVCESCESTIKMANVTQVEGALLQILKNVGEETGAEDSREIQLEIASLQKLGLEEADIQPAIMRHALEAAANS